MSAFSPSNSDDPNIIFEKISVRNVSLITV